MHDIILFVLTVIFGFNALSVFSIEEQPEKLYNLLKNDIQKNKNFDKSIRVIKYAYYILLIESYAITIFAYVSIKTITWHMLIFMIITFFIPFMYYLQYRLTMEFTKFIKIGYVYSKQLEDQYKQYYLGFYMEPIVKILIFILLLNATLSSIS